MSAGENEFGVQRFRELFRIGAVDIAQPDVARSGGITECLRTGKLAQEHGVNVMTHTWSDAVALTANAHVVAALDNGIAAAVDPKVLETLGLPPGRAVRPGNYAGLVFGPESYTAVPPRARADRNAR